MGADIKIVRSDEKYVEYAATLVDPREWMEQEEEPHRLDLVRQFMLLIAEFGEEEIAYAFGCAMLVQEARRRGIVAFKID